MRDALCSALDSSRPLDRRTYALAGVLLLLIKINLDRLLVAIVGRRYWSVLEYVVHPGPPVGLRGAETTLWVAMVALALPFIAAGTLLTLRRLRAIGWSPWAVLLFFVPGLNLLVFALLCVWPNREAVRSGAPPGNQLRRWLPEKPAGAQVMAIVLSAGLGLAGTALAVYGIGRYGWGLFVGLPFAMGFLSVMLAGAREPLTMGQSIRQALSTVASAGLLLFLLAVEGAVCLIMAAPLGLGLGILGGVVGCYAQRPAGGARTTVMLLLCLPALMGAERTLPDPPLIAVRTAVDIDAPAPVVWRHVVAFSEIPPPSEWLFHTGIAYPLRATIRGRGPGAVRECVFSTGAFIEPITVWDAPRRLAFSVTAQPPPMAEASLSGAIDAPHLDDFLRSQRGEFLLMTLPDGRTRLQGTTWYTHAIWPSTYWQLYSDPIIHAIHVRVLAHIRQEAEAESRHSRVGRPVQCPVAW